MNPEYYEANTYKHNLDSLIISDELSGTYPMRSRCREKSIRITHNYLTYNHSRQSLQTFA